MTDRSLTPEIYGDFGLFLEQVAQRPKKVEDTKTTHQSEALLNAETRDSNKNEKE